MFAFSSQSDGALPARPVFINYHITFQRSLSPKILQFDLFAYSLQCSKKNRERGDHHYFKHLRTPSKGIFTSRSLLNKTDLQLCHGCKYYAATNARAPTSITKAAHLIRALLAAANQRLLHHDQHRTFSFEKTFCCCCPLPCRRRHHNHLRRHNHPCIHHRTHSSSSSIT